MVRLYGLLQWEVKENPPALVDQKTVLNSAKANDPACNSPYAKRPEGSRKGNLISNQAFGAMRNINF